MKRNSCNIFFLCAIWTASVTIFAQKPHPIHYVNTIHLPDTFSRMNLAEYYTDSSNLYIYEHSVLRDMIQAAVSDTQYADIRSNETFYVYENSETSELELMKLLREPPVDLATVEGRREARRRLALAVYLTQSQHVLDSTGTLSLQHANFLGWFKHTNGIIYCPMLYTYASSVVWSMDTVPQTGTKKAHCYWFFTRRKPTRNELKQANH